jgi:hypothetical protein
MSKNLGASGSAPRASRLLHPLAILSGLFAGACTFEHTLVTPPPSAGLAAQVQIFEDHTLLPEISTFCTNLLWLTCSSPEYTDDQAFMGANKQTYGPPAFIAPAQNLNAHQSDAAFQAGAVLVGYVYVYPSGTALPSTYTDLKLSYGHNCLYLSHQNGTFSAYVVPQNTICTTYTPNPTHQLNVRPVSSAAFPGHPNIPPVARFHEGNKGPLAGVPFLGIKCGDKWCLILPQAGNDVVSEWIPPHVGVHNDRKTWEVYGWNDSQHLAVRAQGGLARSNMRVSVVADTNLGNLTETQFAQGFQHVATVFFRGSPADKYAATWHYGRGHNEIFLRKKPDQTWEAEIRHTRYILGIPVIMNVTTAPVHRRDHGAPVPATARFLWTATDEDLWIACDDGCCRVAG